jgi:hypothetical protein
MPRLLSRTFHGRDLVADRMYEHEYYVVIFTHLDGVPWLVVVFALVVHKEVLVVHAASLRAHDPPASST